MRVDVKKYLFLGPKERQEEFFREAQKLGVIQFIDRANRRSSEMPTDIQRLIDAMKILRGCPTVEQEENKRDAQEIAKRIIKLKKLVEALYEECRVLRQEIVRVEVFGDFSLDDIDYIEQSSSKKIQFFFSKKSVEMESITNPEVIYVGSDHGLDYFISVNDVHRTYDDMVEMHINQPVGTLRKMLSDTLEAVRKSEKELKWLGRYYSLLYNTYIDVMNKNNLFIAQDYVDNVLEEKVFSIEGWVAESDLKKMLAFVAQRNIHAEQIAIEESDFVPTFLKNKGVNRLGEDLIQIYDAPLNTDRDPSGYVLWAFALFFAIIIGDGGYGLIFLALAIFLRYRFPAVKGAFRRFIKLTMILSVSCVVWGMMTNSFFGIEVGIDSPLRNYSMLHSLVEKKAAYHVEHKDDTFAYWAGEHSEVKDVDNYYDFLSGAKVITNGRTSFPIVGSFADKASLELAIVIGIIHIIISFARFLDRNWAGIGWICFMVGGYLYFPSMLQATSLVHYAFGVDKSIAAEMGHHLMFGGIGLAVTLAIIQRKARGILEIATVIQVFSDVLSYLRLYALALAGAKMSHTFNDIGASIPIIPGILVIVAGHSVNIVLSIMSGVIHGLRLNFLEWYHYCFEGGGKMLKPLSLMKYK